MTSDANRLREDQIRSFLARAGLSDVEVEPLPGDASTRRYARLTRPGHAALMLMDAPPQVESAPCDPSATPDERRAAGYNAMARLAAGRVDAFAACARYLKDRGLSAPEIVALDPGAGLAVVEDLGDDLFARRIEGGADPLPLYQTAVDLLVHLHQEAPPRRLPVGEGFAPWPLLDYDALALLTGVGVFAEWWPKLAGADGFSAEALADWERLWAPIAEAGERGASVFTHRDYHAENLLWLPERWDLARVGLLDFQDAVRAHPAWDLFSLLQDARREVDAELERAMLDRYLAARPDLPRDAFLADYAGLAALNAVRILGVFARLIVRDGKPRYAQFLPRMRRMLVRNLASPALDGLARWFAAHAPMDPTA